MFARGFGRTSLVLRALISALMLAGACGGSATPQAPTPALQISVGQASPPGNLTEALAQLDAMPCPKGAAPETWSALKSAMRAALVGRAEGQGPGAKGKAGSALAPPISGGAQANLSYDDAAGLVRWGYYCPGDYDQNGVVGLPDLVPLAVHFGESTGTGSPFPQDAIQAVVDGDRNGEISLGDIVAIAANFGLRVAGYRVYRADTLDSLPTAPDAPNNPGATLSRDVAFADATGDPTAGRKQFSSPVDASEIAQYYWVRPYDGAVEGTPSDACWVPGTGGTDNYPPVADIKATPSEGDAPLTVELDASGSSDADDAIAKYEWDWNGVVGGLNFFNTGGDPVVEHTYNAAGTYTPMVRVTDARGASDVATTEIIVRVAGVNKPPTASLTVTPNSGATMLEVEWDASGSVDTDGHIVDYTWDFDGDGYFEYDSGLTAKLPYYYYAPGDFSAIVQVTDDDGAVSYASSGVSVSEAQKWHITPVSNPETQACERGSDVFLMEVEGNPAVCYTLNLTPYGEDYVDVFQRAADAEGTTWSSPVAVPDEAQGFVAALFNLDGVPAVLSFPSGAADIYSWRVLRAADTLGTTWLPAEDLPGYATRAEYLEMNGIPAVCFSGNTNPAGANNCIFILHATDHAATSWQDPVQITPPGIPADGLSLSVVAGRLAVAFRSGSSSSEIFFLRAKDSDGTSWLPLVCPVLNSTISHGSAPSLIDAAGMPAIAWANGTLMQLYYCRALDADGRDWDDPQVVAVEALSGAWMISADGRPAILYLAGDGYELRFVAANDAGGAHWGLPVPVAGNVSGPLDPHRVAFAEIGGRLALAYQEGVPYANTDGQLRFAMYY